MDLFLADGEIITSKMLSEKLEEVGIKEGDTIYVHAALLKFGKPLQKKEQLLQEILSVIKRAVGTNGTIVMPTYTYSFCRNEIYNVQTSPSKVGLLSEYFRVQDGVKRTKHPIFSDAIYGKNQGILLDCQEDAFGKGSVFEKMVNLNAKLVTMGDNKGYTFYHYCEELVGVSHRYFKKFDGVIIDGDISENKEVTYYVRDLHQKSLCDDNIVHSFLVEKSVENTVSVGAACISSIHFINMQDVITEKLREDSKYFLREV